MSAGSTWLKSGLVIGSRSGYRVRFGYCLIIVVILQPLFLCKFTSVGKIASCLLYIKAKAARGKDKTSDFCRRRVLEVADSPRGPPRKGDF